MHVPNDLVADGDVAIDGAVKNERETPETHACHDGKNGQHRHDADIEEGFNAEKQAGQRRNEEGVRRNMKIRFEKVSLNAARRDPAACTADQGAVYDAGNTKRLSRRDRKPGHLYAKPPGQRRQRKRQHEPVIEAIGEDEEQYRGDQQVVVSVLLQQVKSRLDIRQLRREHEACEIQHVVEYEVRRFRPLARPRRPPGERVVERRREQDSQANENRGIAEVRKVGLNRPAEPGNERNDAEIQQRIEFDKDGKPLFADDCGNGVELTARDRAGGFPLLQMFQGAQMRLTIR